MINSSDPLPVTMNYDETRIIGSFRPGIGIVELPEEMLAGCVMAPQFIKHADGSVEITGWSLIDGDRYKKPELAS